VGAPAPTGASLDRNPVGFHTVAFRR
jgi:hypothetical protein